MGHPVGTQKVIVIGAGIGGLTAAALLLQAGLRVTVLESQVYPGGSAGTFFHKGYNFDAGATLAGGFSPGGPHARLAAQLGLEWPVEPVDPAWVVHLPDASITQWHDPEHWQEERQRFFPGSESFWKRQESLARTAWNVSERSFPWPPSTLQEVVQLSKAIRMDTILAVPYAFQSIAKLLPRTNSQRLRTFLDAQLLISAQATSSRANALYSSAALDLPRRGVNYVRGGIGSLSKTLVQWILSHGGDVLYRQRVEKIIMEGKKVKAVRTGRKVEYSGDLFLANLTPWGLNRLFGENAPRSLQREIQQRSTTWGAFTLYLGINADKIPTNVPDHHQVILDPTRPLGEGNSVFISISPANDPTRAPEGKRAVTISTHTRPAPWGQALAVSQDEYQALKDEYTRRVLEAAEYVLPGVRSAAELILPGTPLTFEFYTRRPMGMVGGFPQTSLLQARGPQTDVSNLWLVGDSVFPGQSTAGVTLGAMRTVIAVLATSQ
jgi:C-3',4' desaturase CrtD